MTSQAIGHLIFSFPGVLYDDVRVAHSITNKVLLRHGAREIAFEEFREIAEGTLDEFIIPHFFPGYDREVLRVELVEATAGEPKGKLCEGALETLEELGRRGVAAYVVTSKGEAFVRQEMERLGLARFFPQGRFSLAAREWTTLFNPLGAARTKAHGIMRILDSNRIPAGACAYMGHMEEDLREARKAGVRTIALAWAHSYNSPGRLLRAEPDLLLRHIREVPHALASLPPAR
ncbi:MAG: HAD family hydrolase [Candidatus Tectomicrobia bacterium]|nr:HAD family hydrolase [Candidatus Tectomicrobia bacterium]